MPEESVAQFTVSSVQVLAEDAGVDEDLMPDLTDDELLELYYHMKRSRRLDERAIALQRRGELGTYAPAIGQEAAQVGGASALSDDDWTVPSFRMDRQRLRLRFYSSLSNASILTNFSGIERGRRLIGALYNRRRREKAIVAQSSDLERTFRDTKPGKRRSSGDSRREKAEQAGSSRV